MEYDLRKLVNMKPELCIFENLTELKINVHKSEIFYFGKAKEDKRHYKQLYLCVILELIKLPEL